MLNVPIRISLPKLRMPKLSTTILKESRKKSMSLKEELIFFKLKSMNSDQLLNKPKKVARLLIANFMKLQKDPIFFTLKILFSPTKRERWNKN